MAQVKSSDPFPRLIHECARDIGLAILVGGGLMLASTVSANSINPAMHFQQDPQHVGYNDLSRMILQDASLYCDCAPQEHKAVSLNNHENLADKVEH